MTCNGVASAAITVTQTGCTNQITATSGLSYTMQYEDSRAATIPLVSAANETVSAANTLFSNWGCIAVTSCTLDSTATAAGLSISAGADKTWPIMVANKPAGVKVASYKVTCSQMIDKKATTTVSTFSFTWNKCAPLVASKTVADSAVTFAFGGQKASSTTNFQTSIKNFEGLFYVNLACPASSSAPQAAAASTCKLSGVTVSQPSGAVLTKLSTVKDATSLTIYNGDQFGYQAQLSLASCTPAGAASATASVATISQTCYNILTKQSVSAFTLVRAKAPPAPQTQLLFADPLQTLFTGFQGCYNGVKSVTLSASYCTVGKTASGVNKFPISCSLTTAAGYSGPVTVTVTGQDGTAQTSTFSATLPGNGVKPVPTPDTKSHTTAIVLGVIGGIVGVGIIGGVAWYVIKGRADANVDPYDDEATAGLTGEQEQA